MELDNYIKKRIGNIMFQCDQLEKDGTFLCELFEIKKEIGNIKRLLFRQKTVKEPGGCKNHPLGYAPHFTTMIFFRLDRCEELLNSLENCQQNSLLQKFNPEHLLYPSIIVTVIRRLFSILLYLRGHFLKYSVNYDNPTIREIIYLKSPFWLEYFFRQLLPKSRSRWSYSPNKKN